MKRVLIEAYISDEKVCPRKGVWFISGTYIPLVAQAYFDFENDEHHVIVGPAPRVIYVDGDSREWPMFNPEWVCIKTGTDNFDEWNW